MLYYLTNENAVTNIQIFGATRGEYFVLPEWEKWPQKSTSITKGGIEVGSYPVEPRALGDQFVSSEMGFPSEIGTREVACHSVQPTGRQRSQCA